MAAQNFFFIPVSKQKFSGAQCPDLPWKLNLKDGFTCIQYNILVGWSKWSQHSKGQMQKKVQKCLQKC